MTTEGYDYIVAGGGSSGCLVSARLAEAGARVLLLEAGPDDRNPLIRMPAGYVKLLGVERYMWFYKSVPQAHLGGRTPDRAAGPRPRRRLLGQRHGLYPRPGGGLRRAGSRRPATPGWSYAALLPYFTGMEDNERLNDRFHGIGGPWKVSDAHHTCELTRAFLLAAQGIGLPYNPDFNGATQRGVGTWQINARDGRRCSASDGVPAPGDEGDRADHASRPAPSSSRSSIEKGRAVGVRWREGSETREARATTEVVMAAGAIATPKILMLSGIGPAAHLARARHRRLRRPPGRRRRTCRTTPRRRWWRSATAPTATSATTAATARCATASSTSSTAAAPSSRTASRPAPSSTPTTSPATPKVQQFCVPSVYLDKDITGREAGPRHHHQLLRRAAALARARSGSPPPTPPTSR